MATTTVYSIPGYPTVMSTDDGRELTIRPMVPQDKEALLEFFRRIPEEDRFYLKDDVTSSKTIDGWARNLDYGRALPLLALEGNRIVADGTLHHSRAGARKQVGEVRIVVDPDYRNLSIGRHLLLKLTEIASTKHIERLMFEVVADTEEAARRTALIMGYIPVAVLNNHVRDIAGDPHDLVIMELDVRKAIAEESEVF